MRILFTFAGGSGHADPLIPFADSALAAGHAVAFAGRASAMGRVRGRGFTVFGGEVPTADTPPTITPLLELDPEREDRDLREGFAERLARGRAATVLALCDRWSPDVIVCDEVDFGSMIAAERVGIPHATVLVIAAGSFIRATVVADSLDEVRAEHGLPPEPELGMPSRHLVLSPFPPSFRDPAFPLPATARSFRPPALDRGREAVPDWLSGLPDRPTVYFTLGTVFNLESGGPFARVLAGLHNLPITLVVTVGREIDPELFGPQPSNVRIEPYVPQSVLLPRCDAVVSHGGSGTVIGTLAAGLPSVALPMGADQPLNAARCAALGVGLTLDAVRATPDAVGEAVLAVLTDPGYRKAAEGVRDEIAALPHVSAAVPLLEALA